MHPFNDGVANKNPKSCLVKGYQMVPNALTENLFFVEKQVKRDQRMTLDDSVLGRGLISH